MRQGLWFYASILVCLGLLGVVSLTYKGQTAIFPLLVIAAGIFLVAIKLVTIVRPHLTTVLDPQGFFGDVNAGGTKDDSSSRAVDETRTWRETMVIVWGIAFVGLIYLLGFLVASPIMTFLFAKAIGRRSPVTSLAVAAAVPIFLYIVFERLLRIELFTGFVLGSG